MNCSQVSDTGLEVNKCSFMIIIVRSYLNFIDCTHLDSAGVVINSGYCREKHTNKVNNSSSYVLAYETCYRDKIKYHTYL